MRFSGLRGTIVALPVGVTMLIVATQGRTQTADAALHLEAKIPLGPVSGRIDHLDIDLKRQRQFVAELGNDSIGVVDLAANRVHATIGGWKSRRGSPTNPRPMRSMSPMA